MKTIGKLNLKNETTQFALLFIVAMGVYLFNITYSDFWIDETVTKALIQHSPGQMMNFLIPDFHPPLYFYALKLFTYFTGITDFSIRLFSAIGMLATIALSYVVGQRVLGKRGALYWALLILSIPMLAFQARNARMYTWAAFAVTGVFLYACLVMKTDSKSDLFFLGLYSLIAAYMHYYSLIAAFLANVFVAIYLISTRQKRWRAHWLISFSAVLLLLPWLLIFLSQIKAVIQEFWILDLNWLTIGLCYIIPFAKIFWIINTSVALMVIVYGLTLVSVVNTFIRHKGKEQITFSLSLVIFHVTILTAIVFTLIIKPVLDSRYMATIATMLMVPPTLFLINIRKKWLAAIILMTIFVCGLYTTLSASYFSMGPYRQTMEHLSHNYPQVKSIVHATDVTTGPLLNYNYLGNWNHYWIKNEHSPAANEDVFGGIQEIHALDDVFKKGDVFCMVDFTYIDRNRKNVALVLSGCRTVRIDTVHDRKTKNGIQLLLYFLDYKGGQGSNR